MAVKFLSPRVHAWRLVKGVMENAGIDTTLPHPTPKGLRHGFAINALAHEVPLNLVSKWLGHADLKTTAIYLNAVGVNVSQFLVTSLAQGPVRPFSQAETPLFSNR